MKIIVSIVFALVLSGCNQIELSSERNEICLEGIRSWGYSPTKEGFDIEYIPVKTIHVTVLPGAEFHTGSYEVTGESQIHGDQIILYGMDQGTLNHEFGHIFGVPHLKDPNDLMYPYKNGAVLPSAIDILIAHSFTDHETKRFKCDLSNNI